jgi:membrane-bound serine protease (ClpP class)
LCSSTSRAASARRRANTCNAAWRARNLARCGGGAAHRYPGGLDAATREINQDILASTVPVIGWVAPEGARAASAGTYILYACHLAAMAPATSIGAATPVSIGPEPPAPPTTASAPAPTTAMERKVTNDAIAYLHALAQLRGRNVEFADAAVRDAATMSANDAAARHVVDFIAHDADALLRQADGRTVRLRGGMATLHVAGASVTRFAPGLRHRLLAAITEPTVAYLLLLIGLYGLMFRRLQPGRPVPGRDRRHLPVARPVCTATAAGELRRRGADRASASG